MWVFLSSFSFSVALSTWGSLRYIFLMKFLEDRYCSITESNTVWPSLLTWDGVLGNALPQGRPPSLSVECLGQEDGGASCAVILWLSSFSPKPSLGVVCAWAEQELTSWGSADLGHGSQFWKLGVWDQGVSRAGLCWGLQTVDFLLCPPRAKLWDPFS